MLFDIMLNRMGVAAYRSMGQQQWRLRWQQRLDRLEALLSTLQDKP